MKSQEAIAVILVLLATVGTIVGIFGIESCRRSKLYTVELLARSPKNGNWYPREIHLTAGREVRILIRNVETLSHGFALPAFNVGVDEIKAGQVAVVEFTPDKRGTFPFMCTVWCSDEHMDMNGKVIVK